MLHALAQRLATLPGTSIDGESIASADDFTYSDPIDGSVSEHQGLRVLLQDGSRMIFRLSGTGSDKATARIYLERYRTTDLDADVGTVLAPLSRIARGLLDIEARCGRREPTLIT
jgi:phosphoglucomutase